MLIMLILTIIPQCVYIYISNHHIVYFKYIYIITFVNYSKFFFNKIKMEKINVCIINLEKPLLKNTNNKVDMKRGERNREQMRQTRKQIGRC